MFVQKLFVSVVLIMPLGMQSLMGQSALKE